jgi:hypothetical protein
MVRLQSTVHLLVVAEVVQVLQGLVVTQPQVLVILVLEHLNKGVMEELVGLLEITQVSRFCKGWWWFWWLQINS